MNIVGTKQNEAYREFKEASGNTAPSGSKTLRSFSLRFGTDVINCSWQASNGCVIYFTLTVRKRNHSCQPTLITE